MSLTDWASTAVAGRAKTRWALICMIIVPLLVAASGCTTTPARQAALSVSSRTRSTLLVGTSSAALIPESQSLTSHISNATTQSRTAVPGSPGTLQIASFVSRVYGSKRNVPVVDVDHVERMQVLGWSYVKPHPSAKSLTVTWYDGPTVSCGAAEEIRITQTFRQIVISVVVSTAARPISCAAVLLQAHQTIVLSEAVGNRAILEPGNYVGQVPA